MSRSNRRGFALAYVLVMTLILLTVATGVMQMTLQPSAMGASVVNGFSSAKKAEASLARVEAAWSRNDRTCSSSSEHGVFCGGGSGCSCSCTVLKSYPVQSRGPEAGPCTLAAVAP